MKNFKVNMRFQNVSLGNLFIHSIIKTCICQTLKMENVNIPCEINVLITDDNGIQEINKALRQIDKPTDVLSFPMFQFNAGDYPSDWTEYFDPETGLCPLGDMAISLERATMQAKEYGHTLRREIGYLTIHSMLHLLGYDHLDEDVEKRKMREREEIIIATIPRLQRTQSRRGSAI